MLIAKWDILQAPNLETVEGPRMLFLHVLRELRSVGPDSLFILGQVAALVVADEFDQHRTDGLSLSFDPTSVSDHAWDRNGIDLVEWQVSRNGIPVVKASANVALCIDAESRVSRMHGVMRFVGVGDRALLVEWLDRCDYSSGALGRLC